MQAASQERGLILATNMQGTFLKRHKIPKPDGEPYTERDIRVGENVSMYARVFRIVDADGFTREYLSQQGIDVSPTRGHSS